jgi:hypothetical protein
MPRFEFRVDPAWVTLGQGLSMAFGHWRATALFWAIPALVVGILSTLVYWGLEVALVQTAPVIVPPVGSDFDMDWGAILGPLIPQFVVSTVVLGIASMIARWVYLALAVTGLRGGEVTSGWVVSRGLRSLAAELLLLLVYLAVSAGVLVAFLAAGPAAGFLLALAVACAAIYVQVRVSFWSLAIFDGAGMAEGLHGTWRLSQDAVLRMVGWALAVVGLSFLASIPMSVLSIPLSDAVPLQSGIRAGVTEMLAVFQVFALAVLYESQRRRIMPSAVAPGPEAGTGSAAGEPVEPVEPLLPPPPPVPPSGSPWRG